MKLWMLLLLLLPGAASGAERPQDFAFGMALQADGQDALYEVEIPLAVYRGVTRADLGDLRVFNAQGEVVPHALRAPAVVTEQTGQAQRLPVFPIYGEARGRIDDMSVRIMKRADGTFIAVRSQAKAKEQKVLRGFILDAGAAKLPIRELQFDWRGDDASFIGKVRVDGSDDLATWTSLAADAAIARLTFDGQQVRRDRVELRPAKFKYLRISWPENQAALESLKVLAEPAAQWVASARNWQTIEATPVSGKAGEFSFDLGGPVPVDRLRVELPQVNSLVQVQLLTRAKSTDEWRAVLSAIAYRLRQGDTEVSSPEIALATKGDRFWLLRVDQKGGGIGGGAPSLRIGWVAQRLIFAARGAGPFQLAYGSSGVKSAAFAIEAVIPGYKTDAEFKVRPAKLGDPVTLAGAAQLQAPLDYKKIILWSSLILAVLLLGWMALRLSRQMGKTPADPTHTDKAS